MAAPANGQVRYVYENPAYYADNRSWFNKDMTIRICIIAMKALAICTLIALIGYGFAYIDFEFAPAFFYMPGYIDFPYFVMPPMPMYEYFMPYVFYP